MHYTDAQSICPASYVEQVALFASLCIYSTRVHPRLKSIAKMGSEGKYKGNTNRDLLNSLGSPDTSPQPIMMDVPCAIAKAGQSYIVQNVEIPLMAPHLLLHHLYSTNRHRFNEVSSAAKIHLF